MRHTDPLRARRSLLSRLSVTATLFTSAALAGCGGGDTDTGGTTTQTATVETLTLSLARAAGGAIVVTVHAATASGEPVTGAAIAVTAENGTASDVAEKGSGDYEVTVTPAALDTEVPIVATAGDATAKRTALVLTTVGDGWEQAEAIEGLVNTGGWEDGASVSSDGEWLFIGTYVPLDVFSCFIGGLGKDLPACNVVLGPTAAPERPDMLGAERVLGPTEIEDYCPDLDFPPGGEAEIAFMPVSAYGFHRQPDGSYAEPFVIGFSANGCLGPYGLSFAGPVSGSSAEVLFANDDPLTGGAGDSSTDLYWATIELGEKNILGVYSFDGVERTVSDLTAVPLPLPDVSGTQGNVNLTGGRLFWDDESLPEPERDLYFADVTGALPGATISPTKVLGASRPGEADIQPVLDGSSLYWMGIWNGAGGVLSSQLSDGADPALPGSWSATSVVAAPAGPAEGIIAIGEPTVAHWAGETWIYFVYITRSAAGFNGNIGRIKARG